MFLINSIKRSFCRWLLQNELSPKMHSLIPTRDSKQVSILTAANGYIIQISDSNKGDICYYIVSEGENLAEAINVVMMRIKLGG